MEYLIKQQQNKPVNSIHINNIKKNAAAVHPGNLDTYHWTSLLQLISTGTRRYAPSQSFSATVHCEDYCDRKAT